MPTSALSDFTTGVAEVDELTRCAPDQTVSLTGYNAVFRAAVVLLVSHFESYLKGLAEEHVDWLSDGERQSSRIPIRLRELYSIPRLEEIAKSQDATQRASLLKKLDELTCLWKETAKPPRGLLRPKTLVRVVTSASPEVIDSLFEYLGDGRTACDGEIDFEIDGDVASLRIRLALSDVIECRNAIAHGDATRIVTEVDLARYRAFLTSLAQRLDRKAMQLRV